MESFVVHEGLVAPMDRANVDTDLIMPKQFLKSIRRSGFGPNLFDDLRYLDEGVPDADNSTRPLNPDFPLNFPRYQGASILLARENFGCGSSREHAPWALVDYGFRAIIAPSFADIFRSNCFKNGLLPIALDSSVVDRLFAALYEKEGFSLSIDLERQMIAGSGFDGIGFEVDAFRKDCLLKGLDDIGITLQSEEAIRRFETGHKELFPWVFDKVSI
jgi:3-isopropylmalate/(R)-2-methylmalate dehydratase small subunit